MKLIILDAGDAFELHGFNKLLIKHPTYNKTILELYEEIFHVKKIQIVVGYNAMDLMNQFPKYEYIYNKNWQTTGSSYSLSMALDDEPCYIISSDFFIEESIKSFLSLYDNFGVIVNKENKRLASLKVDVSQNKITNIFSGKSINSNPELIGIYKISNKSILNKWRVNCIRHPNLFAGLNMPYKDFTINSVMVDSKLITEINTPQDYINFLKLNYEI